MNKEVLFISSNSSKDLRDVGIIGAPVLRRNKRTYLDYKIFPYIYRSNFTNTAPAITNCIYKNQRIRHDSPIERLIFKNKVLANINSKQKISTNNFHKFTDSLWSRYRHRPLMTSKVDSEYMAFLQNQNLDNDAMRKSALNNAEINQEKDYMKSPSILSIDSANGSSIDFETNNLFKKGEIFWAKIPPFPDWPCIICPDLDGNIEKKNLYKHEIHVTFFGDNGLRSWINKHCLMPFMFEKHAEDIITQCGKKSIITKPFLMNTRKKILWTRAIEEAEINSYTNSEERILQFENNLKQQEETFGKKYKRPVMANPLNTINDNKNVENNYSLINRVRSPTPESSKNDLSNNFAKRRKLSNILQNTTTKDIDEPVKFNSINRLYGNTNSNIFNSEFDDFHIDLQKRILNGDNEKLKKELYEHARKIWMIKNSPENGFNKNICTHSFNRSSRSRKCKCITEKIENVNLNINEANYSTSKNGKNNKERIIKKTKPIEEVIEDILSLNKNYLFRGLSRDYICKSCKKPDNLFKCNGVCHLWIHKQCANIVSRPEHVQSKHVTGDSDFPDDSLLLCKDCNASLDPTCFVCKNRDSDSGERFKCQINWCGKYFHEKCLKYWPQAKLKKSSAKIINMLCPGHICHTCVSDDPRTKFFQVDKAKLAKCIECPATYHLDSSCIPAGTQFFTATQILCPRHGKKSNINANWCFICASGGSLICCETCPTAFHVECLKIEQPEGTYICEECETGRMPLYGELVWAKLGVYRWWPAIIIPPPEVPKNLNLKKHEPNDFCVRFFGSNDYSWINRSRVFLYQEGDWGKVGNRKGINKTYKQALEEARKIFEILKSKKSLQNIDIVDKRLTPLPYVKIKTNKAVPPVKLTEPELSELTICECNPDDINPCGPNSNCLNRVLLTECNPKLCPAGFKCQNQMFEKKEYPQLKVSRTYSKGWGLICEEFISSGSFIIEYVGEIIDNEEFQCRIAQKREEKDENYYFLTLEKDYIIDAGPKGNSARFVNHSCDPNCETQKWTVNGLTRVGLFSTKDLHPNTELTFNYNLECLGDDKKKCFCNSKNCTGFLGVTKSQIKSTKNSERTTVKSKGHLSVRKKRNS